MIFEYHDRGTLIHQLDPRVKTIALVLVVVFSIALRAPVLLVLLFGLTLTSLLLTRIPLRSLVMILILYAVIGAGAILSQALFYRPSDGTLLSFIWLIPPEVPVIGTLTGGILISSEGAQYGFIQAFRILAVMNASAVLVVTTPLNRLIVGLREMKIPATFAFMMATAVRFVPVLMEEYQTIVTALRARRLATPLHPFRMAELSLGPLIINVVRRCNQLALAAESRAFNPRRVRTAYTRLRLARKDLAACVLLAVGAIVFIALSIQQAGYLP